MPSRGGSWGASPTPRPTQSVPLPIRCGPGFKSMTSSAQPVRVTVDEGRVVSGLLLVPPDARVCYVLAHGAGAGMARPFLAAGASGRAGRGVAASLSQVPAVEHGSTLPDAPPL